MANPLIGMMGGKASGINIQAIQQAKQAMNMLKAAKDPQQALMTVAQQNPQLNSIMQMIGGRNPQEVFYEECKKHNVNPDEVLSLLKG